MVLGTSCRTDDALDMDGKRRRFRLNRWRRRCWLVEAHHGEGWCRLGFLHRPRVPTRANKTRQIRLCALLEGGERSLHTWSRQSPLLSMDGLPTVSAHAER